MICENIKELADKKGMSIAAVERAAGLANGTIGKWERSSPTIRSLQLVANVLDVSVSRLVKE